MKQKKRILPLALTPQYCKRISEWCPFENGDPLKDIVDNHNTKCKQIHERRCTPEDVEMFINEIEIVMHDLSRVDRLKETDFETIWIILVDLDAVQGMERELDRIRYYMSRSKHRYYLTQVRKDPNANSLAEFFNQMPVFPYPLDPPQILCNQEDFEHFLWHFCLPGPPPFEIKKGKKSFTGLRKQEYLEAMSKVADDVLHVAITRNLSKEKAFMLTHLAFQQELTLAHVEKMIHPQTHHHVILDAIRKPVVEIAIEPSRKRGLQKVDLIHVLPTRSLNELTSRQRSILQNLGVKGENYSAVNFDMPSTRSLIKNLGNAVKINKFSAELPFGKTQGRDLET